MSLEDFRNQTFCIHSIVICALSMISKSSSNTLALNQHHTLVYHLTWFTGIQMPTLADEKVEITLGLNGSRLS